MKKKVRVFFEPVEIEIELDNNLNKDEIELIYDKIGESLTYISSWEEV